MKYLIVFEKLEAARWLGHLDILRTFERAIRRAELPIAFTTGFNPRERLTFANALQVGVTGANEVGTMELTRAMEPDEIVRRMNENLPGGIQLVSALEIPDEGFRDRLNAFDRAYWELVCDAPEELTDPLIRLGIERFLASTERIVTRERDGKVRRIDVRPFVRELSLVDRQQPGRVRIDMTLTILLDGSVRPAEVIGSLAEELEGLKVRRIHRSRLGERPTT